MKLTEIKESHLNARRTFDEARLKDLAASIKEKGVLQAIIVRPSNGKHEIVCGARRFRAAALAGLLEIPVEVMQLNDKQAIECQVIENLQREDVHPLEEAEGYEVLMKKHGYKTVEDIAVKVGKSRTYIYGRLKLCELIPENRKLFYEGKFSPSVALLLARVPAEQQKKAGKEIAEGDYDSHGPFNYSRAREYIEEEFMLQLEGAPFNTKDEALPGGSCTKCMKRTANQKELFPDIGKTDMCTDAKCFNAKKTAYAALMIAQAKKGGKTVLSSEQAAKIFPYEHSCDPQGGYLSMNQRCYEDGKNRTYGELAKAAQFEGGVFAVHPHKGELLKLITKGDAEAILKKAGVKQRSSDTSHAPDMAKAKKANRIREAKRGFWISKVSTAKDHRCMNVVILDILLEDMGWAESRDLLKGKIKGDSCGRSWSIPKLYELGDADVQALIIKVISKKSEVLDDDDLEFLCDKLGFSVAKDYVISKTYLEALTKDGLVKLAKELKLDLNKLRWQGKKPELVADILGSIPKGKVPKELSEK